MRVIVAKISKCFNLRFDIVKSCLQMLKIIPDEPEKNSHTFEGSQHRKYFTDLNE